ncbi:hypothetical protein M9458_029478, partial [Cirrhinus mrigala]
QGFNPHRRCHPPQDLPWPCPPRLRHEAAECINLFIQMQPQMFPSENAKVAFLISLLIGKALQWAKAIWNSENPIIHSMNRSQTISTTTGTLTTSDQLFRLQQGTSSVNDYTLLFRMLAAASGWNDTVLLGAYRQGLNLHICVVMALYNDSFGLESFLRRTTRVSQRLAACQPLVTTPQLASVAASSPVPEPMQIDSTRLSRTERNRRITNRLSLLPPPPVVSTLSTEVETTSLTLLQVTLHASNLSICVSALVDSGSSGNFFSQDCLNQLQLSYCRHSQAKPLGRGRMHHSSPFITLQVGLFHLEEMRFLVLEDSTVSIILWLQQHRPELSWGPCDIIRWSEQSNQLPRQRTSRSSLPFIYTSGKSFTPEIPAEYMAFQDVFSKQAATHLPPHRPWDCALELLPGAQLSKGRVYPLSIPERQAMVYIEEALSQGFIQPSTLLVTSSFFFMGKKDGAALEELRGAQVITRLDLRSAYNLVRIRAGDEWKTAFVTPTGHYEYRVMPYGLSISPSVFQTFMNEVFWEFLHRFVVVYIDDILIYPRNLAEHRQHVQQ